jgi:hypothetical protein
MVKWKGRAFPDPALHPHRSVHELAQSLADREAEARAAIPAGRRSVDLAERLEQPAQPVLGDPDAGVPDREMEPVLTPNIPVVGLELFRVHQQHYLALFRELHRVVQQVDQDLTETVGVALDCGRHLAAEDVCDLQTFARGGPRDQLEGGLHALAEVERPAFQLQPASFDL